MKTTILLSALVISALCTGFAPISNNPVEKPNVKITPTFSSQFNSFHVHRQGQNGITSAWSITAPGNDVSCFIVERTYDDPSDPYAMWDIVSNTPCTSAKSYKCTENNVFAGFISYRVTANLIAGGSYCTPVETIH